MKKIKLAIVHDDFIQKGGAENLIWEIIKHYSANEKYEVEVFTSIIGQEWMRIFEDSKIRIHSSFLQNFPLVKKYQKVLALSSLYYLAFESFNFDRFDVVFSSSTRYAHSVITKSGTLHLSYVNSPPKMLWELEKYYFGRKNLLKLIKFFLPKLRLYDVSSRDRVDITISNSLNISKKMLKNYQINSVVLHPFLVSHSNLVETINLTLPDSFFLIISRLTAWKRIDFVIESFNLNKKNLIIVGEGEMKKIYQERANSNIQLVGYLNSPHKNFLLSKCSALIFPQDEDFGLVLLEALNFKKPIIYFNKGGAREILNPCLGVPFYEQTTSSLNNAVDTHLSKEYNYDLFSTASHRFNKEHFVNKLEELINSNKNTINEN